MIDHYVLCAFHDGGRCDYDCDEMRPVGEGKSFVDLDFVTMWLTNSDEARAVCKSTKQRLELCSELIRWLQRHGAITHPAMMKREPAA